MSKKADDDAYAKGQKDYSKSGGQADLNPITEFIHPTYNPPADHEEEYKKGWDNAKKQGKS